MQLILLLIKKFLFESFRCANGSVKVHCTSQHPVTIAAPEFPLVLKSRGPGTSSSMKLGVLFAFQGSPDYYRSLFIFLCLFSRRLSYVICSHNYIFSRLTKLALL